MTGSWEGQPLAFWCERWHVPELLVFSDIGSTSDVVRDRAAAGAPAGTVVIAEHQSAGRGRYGRTWVAAPGSSLLTSVLLRPRPSTASAPGTAPLRVGLAVAGALRERFGIPAQLKWPNDIVVEGAKLAGILCEAASTGPGVHIVAGIGINVRQHPHDWPPELRGHATSLAMLCDADVSPADVMAAIVLRLRPLFHAPLEPLADQELIAYFALDALARRPIVATVGSEDIAGTGAGVAADGALLVDTSTGRRRVTAATVRIAPSHTPSRESP